MAENVVMTEVGFAELEARFHPSREVFRMRNGRSQQRAVYSHKKLCFVATDKEYLVRLLYELSEREDCHWTKYSIDPKDGMYLGRAFMTNDRIVGELWDKYKRDAKLMCSVQDDDFTLPFRSG
jgi:hypothetical protein